MREEGFYWVKIHGEWTIGEWYGNHWGQILGYQGLIADSQLEEIDEIKITRFINA